MDEIKIGDLVDFGVYGQLYVCNPDYSEDYFWVTDSEEDRTNPKASGWSIEKILMQDIIETIEIIDESVELHESNSISDDTFKVDMKNLADDIDELADDFTFEYLKGDYKGAQFTLAKGNKEKYIYGKQSQSGEIRIFDDEYLDDYGNKPSDFVDSLRDTI